VRERVAGGETAERALPPVTARYTDEPQRGDRNDCRSTISAAPAGAQAGRRVCSTCRGAVGEMWAPFRRGHNIGDVHLFSAGRETVALQAGRETVALQLPANRYKHTSQKSVLHQDPFCWIRNDQTPLSGGSCALRMMRYSFSPHALRSLLSLRGISSATGASDLAS